MQRQKTNTKEVNKDPKWTNTRTHIAQNTKARTNNKEQTTNNKAQRPKNDKIKEQCTRPNKDQRKRIRPMYKGQITKTAGQGAMNRNKDT